MMSRLEQRPYGGTGEQVTVVGLGGVGLPRVSFADGVATVHRALELGITYLDTAPLYGHGVAQAILGEALVGRREPYLLATKLGHLAQPRRFRSPQALCTQFEENLRLLRRDSVDVLKVHEADLHCWWSDDPSDSRLLDPATEYDFANAPIIQVLQEEKAQGRCRFVGITGNTPDRLARILPAVEVDTCLTAFNYGVIHRGARRQLLPVARERGVAVILGGVFQQGRLVVVRPEWLHTPPSWMTPEVQSRVARLSALQQQSQLSLVALTLRYLVADPGIATILVGAATPAEIEASVAAVQAGPLPSDLHQAVEALGLP
ncbi:MAG: hypothetical protein CMJ87_06130 [Planctomycetes bacterium]|nr:hypothetical protein [Planctomycetota bacterium]